MSAVLAYVPVVGAMTFFFGAIVFQARAHPGGRTPEQARLGDERERF